LSFLSSKTNLKTHVYRIFEGKPIELPAFEKLNQFEMDFINSFSQFYELRGRSETLGQVFGLLFLRAPSPERGLTQKEIASLIGKSKSSISRILDLLIEQQFCAYALEDNEMARAERRYFVRGSFKELTIDRTKQSMAQDASLKASLQKITESIPNEEKSRNQDLLSMITQFRELIDILKTTQEKTLEILQEHYTDQV
jgi:DNA-binding transcriptional regulator GbsR (MarR family)